MFLTIFVQIYILQFTVACFVVWGKWWVCGCPGCAGVRGVRGVRVCGWGSHLSLKCDNSFFVFLFACISCFSGTSILYKFSKLLNFLSSPLNQSIIFSVFVLLCDLIPISYCFGNIFTHVQCYLIFIVSYDMIRLK